jgi:hypothetical protein
MVAGFWTLDRTTITGRSAVIMRQQTTPFRPMIVPFDDLELIYQSLRTLEPPHTHKFPRVSAQDCKLGPIQPWDVKDFLRPGRGPYDTLDFVLRDGNLERYIEQAKSMRAGMTESDHQTLEATATEMLFGDMKSRSDERVTLN